MSGYVTKVYIVQKFDRDGTPREVIAAKLTFSSAHQLAKDNAPAKVIFAIADKTLQVNVPAHE
ncbi:hypothetical protein [Hyphomicrobium sp.]|uniref:hypothetical protein n=1 Tax=Hyphomicrobium sp. TaxID=82 RepID=UPI001E0A12CB|nr:hypothetical protein [Hyphomicrobium sp.]MBY0560010.1 hypothetical protein [Hyphomicrobium sp.]